MVRFAECANLLRALDGAELWAVVKADGYGHGAVDVGRAALEAGATALCVATVPEGLAVRAALPEARILVMGPSEDAELPDARRRGSSSRSWRGRCPTGVPVHLKLDTGMGRWGVSELPSPDRNVVGVMSHLASADCDPSSPNPDRAVPRALQGLTPSLTRHLANSAGALRFPAARFDAARCGIAIYGLSVRQRPRRRRPRAGAALRSRAGAGQAAGAGRLHRVRPPFRRRPRDLDRDRPGRLRRRLPARPHRHRGGRRRRAVPSRRHRLDGRVRHRARSRASRGDAGDADRPGASAEAHARVAGTISYELVTAINRRDERARRTVAGA